MEKLFLYNSLSKKKEEFKPIKKNKVGLYTCGPTVYNYAHLGNLRTFLFYDFLKRTLQYNDYQVMHVENITDVGHLSGDMDMGEDKVELGAKREGKNAWQIVEEYTQAFKSDIKSLNILDPDIWARATDYIDQQIELIKSLEKKGYVYQTSDGLYFDSAKFKDYNRLSHLSLKTLKEGARVEKNDEKKNPTDFALWKFSPVGAKRQMEWNSPWGIGFPGWHIECSAIALNHLKNNLDIHCGGIDHINIHHSNEIAQSEAATGKKFFNYWLHSAFLNIIGGKKMAKSDDSFVTVKKALLDKNIEPLAFRFAALQVHYRKTMEYSQENLKQAQDGYISFKKQFIKLDEKDGKFKVNEALRLQFLEAINDDLNMPKALALANVVLRAKLPEAERKASLLEFDKVLGLGLNEAKSEDKYLVFEDLSEELKTIIMLRQKAREIKDFKQSDVLRDKINSLGYEIKDDKDGFKISKK